METELTVDNLAEQTDRCNREIERLRLSTDDELFDTIERWRREKDVMLTFTGMFYFIQNELAFRTFRAVVKK